MCFEDFPSLQVLPEDRAAVEEAVERWQEGRSGTTEVTIATWKKPCAIE